MDLSCVELQWILYSLKKKKGHPHFSLHIYFLIQVDKKLIEKLFFFMRQQPLAEIVVKWCFRSITI